MSISICNALMLRCAYLGLQILIPYAGEFFASKASRVRATKSPERFFLGNYIGFDPKKSVIHIKVQLSLDFFRIFAIVYKTIAI